MGTNASLGDATSGSGSYAEHEANRLRNLGFRGTPAQRVQYFDDFVSFADEEWAIVQDGTVVAVTSDQLGGWVGIITGTSDTHESYYSSLSEAFIFNTTDKVFFETRVKNTAVGDAGDAGFVVGLSDTVAANTIVDAGTLATSLDGAVFILEEEAEVAFITSNASSQSRTAAAYDWTRGDTVKLGFVYLPNDGTTAKVVPIVNGVAGTAHDLTISGLEEMHLLLGVKAHSANAQTLEVDWVQVVQETNR